MSNPPRLVVRSLLLLSIELAGSPAAAVEVTGEVSGGRDFLYLTSDVRVPLLDDRLAVGAGYVLVSDFHATRHGARASVALDLDPVTLGLEVSWAPRQLGRGWLALQPGLGHRVHRPRVAVDSGATLTLRRADVGTSRGGRAVDQLQLRIESDLEIDERYCLGAFALASLYRPDLGGGALREVEGGLLVTLGGGPERWALGARGGWRWARRWRGVVGLAAVGLVDGTGQAILPSLTLRSGPWRWITVEVSAALAIRVPRSGAPESGSGSPRFVSALAVEVAP